MLHASTKLLPAEDLEPEGFDFQDPFFGLLGQKSGRDDLWLGKKAPRYTSYPPATAFGEPVTAEAYRKVLARIAPEEPISLYVHVPYCKTICLYCGCHTCATQKHEEVSSYLDAVHKELETIALSGERQRRLHHIHVGGGSPNMMSEKDMGLFFGALARRFDLSGCRDISIELDPRLISQAQVRTLRMLGVTRVSLGIQDFDPDVQKAIGRVQPLALVTEACALLRANGIEKINFDLLYGLPFQSPASLADTARQVLGLRPHRIALFSYAHIPQAKKHQRALEQYIMPGPYAALAMETAARNIFRDGGYCEVGMDHFALPQDSLAKAAMNGGLRRSFQGYTQDNAGTQLGVGASSIGRTARQYIQNTKDIASWKKQVQQQGVGPMRGYTLHGEDRLRAAIIESLMCHMSVNLEAICRQFNYSLSVLGPEMEALEPFEAYGIIQKTGYKIRLAIPNRQAIRVVAAIFDKNERPEEMAISRAV